MNRQEALILMRLTDSYTPEQLEKSYVRMRKRYPAQQFADRSQEISLAYEILNTQPSDLNELFQSDTLIFERLTPFLHVDQQEISKRLNPLTTEELSRLLGLSEA